MYKTCFVTLATITLCLFATVPGRSSVLPVDLKSLSTSAELIFEGEIIGVDSSFDADQVNIHTWVTFRVLNVVKGVYSQPELALRFLGGTVGEFSLAVSDSTLPEVGEVGIYFVESPDRFQVNPFYGMDQGHFLILESSGQRVMMTRNRRIVTDLSTDGEVTIGVLSNGIARGLLTEANADLTDGVTVIQFIQQIRGYIAP